MKYYDRVRGTSTQRGYGVAWRRARDGYLRSHPFCTICLLIGKKVRATDVDHIIPHKGDQRIFWDRSNWRAICDSHHSSKSAHERHGTPYRIKGADAKGIPLDPNHPWNKDK